MNSKKLYRFTTVQVPGGRKYPMLPFDGLPENGFDDHLTRHGELPAWNGKHYGLHTFDKNTEMTLAEFAAKYRMYVDPTVKKVLQYLTVEGYQAFVVGGAPRNILFNRRVKDWDVSTSALPDKVVEIFRNFGYTVVETGIEHGTVTVVVDGMSIEVTTFRKDVATDGRRAVVEFSKNIFDDCQRRDLTINALYVDHEGFIYDPSGKGLQDVFERRLDFVGNAYERIREDTLRVLRAIRLTLEFDLDTEDVEYIFGELDYNILDNLSAERIIAEISRFNLSSSRIDFLANHAFFLESFFKTILHVTKFDEESIGKVRKFKDLDWFWFWMYLGVPGTWFMEHPAISSKIKKKIRFMSNCHYLGDDSWYLASKHGIDEIRELQTYLGIIHEDLIDSAKTTFPFMRALPETLDPSPIDSSDFMFLGYQGVALGRMIDLSRKIWYEYRCRLDKYELLRLTKIKYEVEYGFAKR